MSSLVLDQAAKVSPPNDSNIRVKAISTTSQRVDISEYATPANPNGQMFLTLQADGADAYVVFTSDPAAVASATATGVVGSTYPTAKIPNGMSLTVHHTASLSNIIAVVGSAAGFLRYWRSSRIGAT